MSLPAMVTRKLGRVFFDEMRRLGCEQFVDQIAVEHGMDQVRWKHYAALTPAARETIERGIEALWSDFEGSAKEQFRGLAGKLHDWAMALRAHHNQILMVGGQGVSEQDPQRIRSFLEECLGLARAAVNLPMVLEMIG